MPPLTALLRLGSLIAGLIATHAIALTGHPLLGISLTLAVLAFVLYGTFSPYSRVFGPVVTRTNLGTIWLTIDDGPDPHDTPEILDILENHSARATFFLIGEKAALHPELVKEILLRGHSIANHTQTHPHFSVWSYGPWRQWREISQAQKTLADITGSAPTLYRAPVGHFNLFTHPCLKRAGLRLISWSSRGFDASRLPLEKILEKLTGSVHSGAIVLIHESTPHAIPVLEAVLESAAKHSLTVSIPTSQDLR